MIRDILSDIADIVNRRILKRLPKPQEEVLTISEIVSEMNSGSIMVAELQNGATVVIISCHTSQVQEIVYAANAVMKFPEGYHPIQ